jgi:hypothetical protein
MADCAEYHPALSICQGGVLAASVASTATTFTLLLPALIACGIMPVIPLRRPAVYPEQIVDKTGKSRCCKTRPHGIPIALRCPKENTMAAAAIFCAFLAPFFALIVGLALVTFSRLKRAPRSRKFFSTALFVAGITALGWAPVLLTSNIRLWPYIGVLVLSGLYQAVVIIFVSAEMLSDNILEESPHKTPRASSAGNKPLVTWPRDPAHSAAALDQLRQSPPAPRAETPAPCKAAPGRVEPRSLTATPANPALVSRH